MKSIYKSIAFILALTMFISTSAFAVEYGEELENMPQKSYTQTFSDVPTGFWAFDYIAELVSDKVLSGYPDNTFKPNNNVTRAEFAKIMISASGLSVSSTTQTSFSDVSVTAWYCPYIETAKPFLTGYNYDDNNVYLPNKMAIREDIAVALVKLKGYDISVADLSMLQAMFTDYNSISESAKKYVAVAVERGLVSGYEDRTFKAQQSITRAEAATLIWRANQYGNDNKTLASETESTTPTTTPPPQSTATPQPTAPSTDKKEEEQTVAKKPYMIDTIASADVLSYVYDGNDIYYISDNKVFKLNPLTGKQSTAFDTSDLTYKETEKQEKTITKTVTKSVPVEEEKKADGDGDVTSEKTSDVNNTTEVEKEPEAKKEPEVEKEPEAKKEPEVEKEPEAKKEPEMKEVTEEVTETVTEDVVVAEYSDYTPEILIYDNFNNHIIIDGYYTKTTKPFKGTESEYTRASYNVDNKEMLLFGNYVRLKACLKNNGFVVLKSGKYSGSYCMCYSIIDSKNNTKSILSPRVYDNELEKNFQTIFSINNNIYMLYGYDENLCRIYDFSKGYFTKLVVGEPTSKRAYNGEDIYSWNITRSGESAIQKTSLTSGKQTELAITTESSKCEIKDMLSIDSDKVGIIIIPIDDNNIVFYDKTAKAFRKLCENK